MKKKLLGILLTAMLVVCAFTLCAGAADPVTISTADELIALMNPTDAATAWAADYVLGANIDLSTATEGSVQAPIGSLAVPYTGNFDGAGYTISGVAITTETDFTAFFGCVENGSIKNLTVVGSVTSTKTYTGGIVGAMQSPYTMTNCVSRVTVSSTGSTTSGGTTGGVVAVAHFNDSNSKITIKNCANRAAVSGYAYVGGIVGTVGSAFAGVTADNTAITVSNNTIEISECFNFSTVKSTKGNVVGGIVGYFRLRNKTGENVFKVERCANYAALSATSSYAYVGGIVGAVLDANNSYVCDVTFSECFNNSTFTAKSSSYNGAIVADVKAFKSGSFTLRDSWNGKSGLPMVGAFEKATTAYNATIERCYSATGTQMVKALTDINTAEGTVANPVENVNLTMTGNCAKNSTAEEIAALVQNEAWVNYFDGAALREFSEIASVDDLLHLMAHSELWVGNYVLTSNIDLTGLTQNSIGSSSVAFTGNFDGNGHTVSGIKISGKGTLGFFGKVKNGAIKNLTVIGTVTSSSGDYIGGLLGHAVDGVVIDNCIVDIDVTAPGSCVAGVVGCTEYTSGSGSLSITNTINKGDVKNSKQYAGGILGLIKTGTASKVKELTIANCVNIGNITVSNGNCAGGIVGLIRPESTTETASFDALIDNCANYGDVTTTLAGNGAAGGIVGQYVHKSNTYTTSLTVTNVYNEGNVTSAGTYVGGIAGYLYAPKVAEDGSVPFTFSDWLYKGENADIALIGGFDTTTASFGMSRVYNAVGSEIIDGSTETAGTVTAGTYTVTVSDACNKDSTDFSGLLASEEWALKDGVPTFAGLDTDTSIDSAEEFVALMRNPALWDEDLVLTTSIDISGMEQSPIGDINVPFTGTFDGQSNTISGINLYGANTVGLFGATRGATIRNLTLNGEVESVGEDVATLIGIAYAPITVDNIVNNANVLNINGKHAAGVIGTVYFDEDGADAVITNCVNNGKIEADSYAGGIVGLFGRCFTSVAYCQNVDSHSNDVTVTGCVNNGEVVVVNNSYAGGIVGYYMFRKGSAGVSYFKVNKCVNYGQVKATDTDNYYVGGIIGCIIDTNNAVYCDIELSELYNNGTVSSVITGKYVGSIAAFIRVPVVADDGSAAISVHDCWNDSTSNYPMLGAFGAKACTWSAYNLYNSAGKYIIASQTAVSGEVTQNSNVVTLTNCFNNASATADALAALVTTTDETDESCVWVNRFNAPELKEFAQEKIEATLDSVIDSVDEFIVLVNSPDRWAEDYTLGADLDLEGYEILPIGTAETPFTGSFTGTGYTISNLTIDMPTVSYVGMFGVVKDATITGVTLVDANVTSYKYAAGLVAYIKGTTQISECNISANVTALDIDAGMLVSFVEQDNTLTNEFSMTNCTANGTLEGGRGYAGMIGRAYINKSLTVIGCTNNATISSQEQSGGIIGRMACTALGGVAWIENCVNNGAVSATESAAAGIIGEIQADRGYTMTVKNCENHGDITAETHSAAGLFAYLNNYTKNNEESNVTFDGFINTGVIKSNTSDDVGGVVGYIGYNKNTAGPTNFTIKNATNKGAVQGRTQVAGLIGYANSTSILNIVIEDSVNEGDITSTQYNAGGIIGKMYVTSAAASLKLDNVTNKGDVVGGDRNGGLVGFLQTSQSNTLLEIYDSENYGSVTAAMMSGGIIGRMEFGGSSTAAGEALTTVSKIKNVANYGDILVDAKNQVGTSTYNGKYVGGIVGLATTTGNFVEFDNIYNSGAVHSTDAYSGGVFGYMRSYGNAGTGTNTATEPMFTLNNAYNCGAITSDGVHVGGLVAFLANIAPLSVTNSVTVTDVSGTGTTHAAFGVRDETSSVKHVVTNVYYAGTPADPNATAVGAVNDYSAFASDLWMIPVAANTAPELKAYHECENMWYQSAADSLYYYGCVCGANTVISAVEAPYVYLAQDGGNDENDGFSAQSAVATVPEAYERIGYIGGKIILASNYSMGTSNLNLPACENKITFTSESGELGFVSADSHGRTINLAGPTAFENLVFNCSRETERTAGAYYNTIVIAANWHDLTVGPDIDTYGNAFIIAGSNGVKAGTVDRGGATTNITLYRTLAHSITDDDGKVLTNAVAFYNMVILGDRVQSTAGYTVKNANVNFVSEDATFATVFFGTTSTAAADAQMENCTVTATFNGVGDAYINSMYVGDANVTGGTAFLDKLELSLNGTAYIKSNFDLRNIKDIDLLISGGTDRKDVNVNTYRYNKAQLKVINYGEFTAASTVDVTYGAHSFASGVAAPKYSDIYTVNETVISECESTFGNWVVTVEPTPTTDGVETRTCTFCGRTEERVAKFNAVVIIEAVAGDITAGKLAVDVKLSATGMAATMFSVTAPAGFTLESITDVDDNFYIDYTEVGTLPCKIMVFNIDGGDVDVADALVLTLNFAVNETVFTTEGKVDLVAIESANWAEQPLGTYAGEAVVVHKHAPVSELVLVADTAEKAAHYEAACICGQVYEEEAEAHAYIASYSSAVVLESDLGLQILVRTSDKIADASKLWLIVESTDANGVVTKSVVHPYHAYPTDATQTMFAYRFNAARVAAKNLTDDISVTFCVNKDNVKYQAQTVTTNIISYYKAADNAGASETIMKVLDAMMNYAAAAQEYFEYSLDKLATAVSGAEKIDYSNDTSITVDAQTVRGTEELTTEAYTYTGVGAYLRDKVVTTISYEGVADDTLVFKGYYTNIKGEVKTVEEKVYIYDGAVRVDLDDIAIKDLRQGVTGALYNADGVQVSKSITTNFEVYATQAISKFDDSKLHAVCRAAFAYSDAARDYFLAQ